MSRSVVVTDSTADFPGVFDGHRIKVVSFCATPDGLLRAFKKAGPKILFLRASTKLNGTLQSAERAKNEVPFHFEVKILDSKTFSLGLGFLVMRAAEMAETGMNLDALEVEVNQLIPKVRLYGIFSKNSSFFGSAIHAKSIISIKNGEITPVEKSRSKSKPMDRLVEIVVADGEMTKIGVIHADAEAEAKELARRLKAIYPGRNIPVVQTGTIIGTHSGPGLVGICGILK